jgi:hypothetical protein
MRVDKSRGNRLIVSNTDELGGGGMRQPGQRLVKHTTTCLDEETSLSHRIKYRREWRGLIVSNTDELASGGTRLIVSNTDDLVVEVMREESESRLRENSTYKQTTCGKYKQINKPN